MDELKATTRKIQAVFPEEIQKLAGVLRVEAQEKVYSIIVEDRFTETLDKVEALNPVYIETLDMVWKSCLFILSGGLRP